MSTAIADIYADVCHAVLESPALAHAYSANAFLRDILVAARTLLQTAPLVQNIFSVSGTSGVGAYAIPDGVGEVLAVFWNGNYLKPSTAMAMNDDDPQWESESRTPETWHMDLLDPDTIRIAPLPVANGTLKIVGTEQPTASSLSAGDNIPLVPDTLTHYLMFACLQKIWEMEGEGRDLNRAKYCKARLDELTNVLKVVASEEYAEVL